MLANGRASTTPSPLSNWHNDMPHDDPEPWTTPQASVFVTLNAYTFHPNMARKINCTLYLRTFKIATSCITKTTKHFAVYSNYFYLIREIMTSKRVLYSDNSSLYSETFQYPYILHKWCANIFNLILKTLKCALNQATGYISSVLVRDWNGSDL